MLYSVVFRRFISLSVLNLLILLACGVSPEQEKLVSGVSSLAETESATHIQIPALVSIPDLNPGFGSTLPKPSLLKAENIASQQVGVTKAVPPQIVKNNTYSVVADNVPVKEILQTIARDSQTRVSFMGDIEGDITLTVVNQPLEFILRQISQLAPVRYELHGERLLLL